MHDLLTFSVKEKDWLQKFKDWDLDLTDIWRWFWDLAQYYLDTFGWVAYVGIALAVIFLLLSFDLTHDLTSQVVSGVIKAVSSLIIASTLGALVILARMTGSSFVARWRDAVRHWDSRLRKEAPETAP